MIEINNLTYSYPRSPSPAIVDITTSIDEGEFVLVAGPSGAGKSSLLRSLNGLIPHYSGGRIKGSVVVNGLESIVEGPKILSSVVGFVFQDPETQNVLDRVEDELAFGLENAAVPAEEMAQRIDQALEVLELTDFRQRQIATLSGGERQRLAIASVLVMRPRVIALDEPTSQLDPHSAADLLKYLVRLNEDWKLTVVMVEHRLERVAKYADRILYLDKGRLTIDEPIRQGVAHVGPANTPPLTRLSNSMGWDPMPLTSEDGFQQAGVGTVVEQDNISDYPKSIAQLNSPIMSVKDVHFSYNGQPALNGVDFDIRAGEAVAILGRNGSGKSTLLKCLVGLLTPDQGEIKLQGNSIIGRDVSAISQNVAFLPQNPDDLLFADTVIEELEITLKNHDLDEDQLSLSPAELLESLELGELSKAYPRDLSAGQRQRVAIGAVVVPEPLVVLLDEPTRGLDYNAKSRLVSMWRQWQKDGKCLILVTHDVELAARACDRVLILERGKITADGPTSEVLSRNADFQPQLVRIFPDLGWLTVKEAVNGLTLMSEG